jgi:hypothetical protein
MEEVLSAVASGSGATAGSAASPATTTSLRFVDPYWSAFDVAAVELLDRRIGGLISRHLDEAETTRTAGRAIHYHLRAFDLASFRKSVLQILIGYGPSQITNVQSAAH